MPWLSSILNWTVGRWQVVPHQGSQLPVTLYCAHQPGPTMNIRSGGSLLYALTNTWNVFHPLTGQMAAMAACCGACGHRPSSPGTSTSRPRRACPAGCREGRARWWCLGRTARGMVQWKPCSTAPTVHDGRLLHELRRQRRLRCVRARIPLQAGGQRTARREQFEHIPGGEAIRARRSNRVGRTLWTSDLRVAHRGTVFVDVERMIRSERHARQQVGPVRPDDLLKRLRQLHGSRGRAALLTEERRHTHRRSARPPAQMFHSHDVPSFLLLNPSAP